MPLALVTGATGQVGSHIVERLVRDGWQVRALVRDPAAAAWLEPAGATLARGDVRDAASVAAAAAGCDVIFHTAALVMARSWEAYHAVNVEGTGHVIAAARAHGARLVHVSSVAVYGSDARYGAAPTDEDAPLLPLPDAAWYPRSKREAEALVMAAHRAGGLWATAVRPDVIYGRRDRQFVPRVARGLARGVFPLVDGGGSTLAIVHAANVADGAVRAAVIDAAGGRAYNLANDYAVTVRDFARLAGEGLGRRVRLVRVPVAAARAGFTTLALALRAARRPAFAAHIRGSIDFLTRDNPFSSERARRELAWAPPVEPATGIPDAFRWWASHHAG